jgi:serine protease Do
MKSWKSAALAAAVIGSAGVGAALAPVAHGQSSRVVTPRAVEVFNLGGGRIGVSVTDLDPADTSVKASSGVLIESVSDDSPAAKAGLRKGDVVVEFDGERVRSVRQFSRLVSETPVGRTVAAAVQRDGQRVTVNLAPREQGAVRWADGDLFRGVEELQNFAYTVPRGSDMRRDFETLLRPGGAVLGITTGDLTGQLGEYFGTKEGALVSSVRADSLGAKTGLKAGDVITSVNGAAVTGSADLRRRLLRLESDEEFTLGIVRDKKAMTLKGKVEPRQPARRGTTRSIL